MVKLKAPLGSTEARGTLAGLVTFSNRRGRHVAGVAARPAQPRTEAQRATRIYMTWLTRRWADISPHRKITWLNFADTPLLSPYHAYVSHNIQRFKNLPGLDAGVSTIPNWPGQAYPVGVTGTVGNFTGETTTPGEGFLDFTRNVTSIAQQWGYAYFHITAEHPKPVYRNLARIETVQIPGWKTTRIENLPPGPCTIKFIRFTTDGKAAWFNTINTVIL